ncbi:hypothetical protein F503_06111 [Ophiostoma piceae UAMH 11346]|uniref:Gtpase activating protein n=1 Tax=Ophiostoma piceae (strain UAMH 11346) TaxID=1262450 RepID=S3CNS0_OPHP1|nr:hypothetical protein F503_06111 [Ophiostoma piceae UAMH 11346]
MSLAQTTPVPGGSLAPPFEPVATSSSSSTAKEEHPGSVGGEDKKRQKLRSLFGFGKKKSADVTGDAMPGHTGGTAASGAPSTGSKPTLLKPAPTLVPKMATSPTSETAPKPAAAKTAPVRKPTSPIQTSSFSGMSASSGIGGSTTTGGPGSAYGGYHVLPPSSPGRSITALSSSPRISSPAGSQIFERDVQESSSVPMPNSPAIPSHISTENHIPPVLDASSEAITDGHLDPDTVEIITHTHHLTVAGGSASGTGVSSSGASGTGAWVEDLASSFVTDRTDKDDGASNYGSFDATDVRRLSFISFADVVQAEQQQQQHQQATAGQGSLAGLASLAALGNPNRSPSPMRSPAATDRLGTSPPTSKSGSIKGLELSPPLKTIGSPTRSPKLVAAGSSGNTLLSGGDISVETMSQALRRTASGDFSGARSTPQSPI